MVVTTSYRVDIKDHNKVFMDTLEVYRRAVDFIIGTILSEWPEIETVKGEKNRKSHIEHLIHKTAKNPEPKYGKFDALFYKLPIYMMRSAIADALGLVCSYKSNLASNRGAKAPRAGDSFPCMYRDGMYLRTGEYAARLKVFIRSTWDWIDVRLDRQDVEYLKRRFGCIEDCAPYLVRHGKRFSLRFAFKSDAKLHNTPIRDQVIVSCDLGINNACVCSVMNAEGAVLGRSFLKLPGETDSLDKAIGRIKKAQQHGAVKTPGLWALAKSINKDIAVKTAHFIVDTACLYSADTIVFEHLDLSGRKRGSKKQRLHMWKAQDVQSMVENKAHLLGIRISRVNAWGTSRLAFDGSGTVKRDKDNYSMCTFASGKRYHADLSASYNIGARYFIREILKSLTERKRLALEAKVPQAARRSTCTLSTLISLNAELTAPAA